MNGLTAYSRNSYIGIKNVSKTPESMLNLVIVAVCRSALHDFIVLGLYNVLYTGFVWNVTRCLTIGVSNDGENLNAMQIIVVGW